MRYFVILICYLLILFYRYQSTQPPEYINGTQVRITARLTAEPITANNNIQKFPLAGIIITASKFPEYHYGDTLVVNGVIKNNQLLFPQIDKLQDKENKPDIIQFITLLRLKIDSFFRRSLPEPQASLLSGIVLGIKSNLPKDFYQNLIDTGTMHVVVASGMNVALISQTFLDIFLKLLKRRYAIVFANILIWFYVLLAGAGIPVVRAGIMGSLAISAQIVGRKFDSLRALILAVMIILAIDPRSILDIGFQLSFAATLGIIILSKNLSNQLSRLPTIINRDLGQIISAQIFTFPIIISNFGFYPLTSIVANLLVTWTLIWILKLGLLAGIAGVIIPALGYLLCLLILPLLTYFTQIVKILGG